MSIRATISRREPVITLTSFRYRGRNYKEGSFLDRRRTRMPNSRLRRFLRDGICILAKDLKRKKLLDYGFVYDNKAPRLKLIKIDTMESRNQVLMDFLEDDENKTSAPTIRHNGGGWYDVLVDEEPINKSSLRKDAALALMEEKAGE